MKPNRCGASGRSNRSTTQYNTHNNASTIAAKSYRRAAPSLRVGFGDGNLAYTRGLRDEEGEAASLCAGWDEENLSLARRLQADENAILRLQEEDRRRLQEEDDAAMGQVTEKDRRDQERRLKQLTSQKPRSSWARAFSRSRSLSRKPDTSRRSRPATPGHQLYRDPTG